MPAKADRIPKYRLHKASGRAVVTLNGRDYYLGRFGSDASREKYNRLVAEWLAGNRQMPPDQTSELTVVEVMAAYWLHAQVHYRRADGSPTSELGNQREAFRPLKRLYGSTLAAEFGPRALKAVRQEMILMGWCRTNINRQIGRIRLLFKWAAAEELVPASVHHGLQALAGLKPGRSDARESKPVRPVPDVYVEAVQPHVSRQVWAMIQLQRLTGMRPGEVVAMRATDLDTSGKVWAYALAQHKTAHHGCDRVIYLGPRAQGILEPFLAGRRMDAFLFSPAEAEIERHAQRRSERKTPVQPSQVQRAQSARKRRRSRPPGSRYDVNCYRRAIARACRQAVFLQGRDVPPQHTDRRARVASDCRRGQPMGGLVAR